MEGLIDFSPVTRNYNFGDGYKIEQKKNKETYGNIRIKYEDYEHTKEQKLKELNNEFASEEKINKEIGELPKGGYIKVNIERSTIGAANTEMFEYVIFENGKEIYRKKGTSDIAETPINPGEMWWNIDIIELSKEIETSITLYVIDKLGGRDEFIISKIK